MLTIAHKTTTVLAVTLTDTDGDPVTGATVTVTIVSPSGSALATDEAMNEQAAGTYEYTISADLLPTAEARYTAQITADDGQNEAYAEIALRPAVDRD